MARPKAAHPPRGQMTVEFVVALPAMIVVAVIAVNAMTFLSDCAAFDRSACEAVRVWATSPAYGASSVEACASIKEEMEKHMSGERNSVLVNRVEGSYGLVEYRLTLEYAPTLFGIGFKSSLFGVSMPRLSHTVSLTVSPYKPGVLA